MTILTWTPYDRGHISQVTINPGDNTYLSLRAGSYNFVDVYPAWLVVNNVENSDDVDVVTDSGLTVTVPGATSKSIIIAMHSGVRIQNNNAFSIECTVFDSRISRDIIDGFTASLLAARQIDYALLAHFDADNERMLGDGRVTPQAYTVTAGGKFGNCLEVGSDQQFEIGLEEVMPGGVYDAYTIDFWLKILGTLGTGVRVFSASPGETGMFIQFSAPNATTIAIDWRWGGGTTTQAAFTVSGATTYMQTWRHVALEVRPSAETSRASRVYLDGVMGGSVHSASAGITAATIRLGYTSTSARVKQFDELRIVRYPSYMGANFTPPTEPYS